MQVRYHKQFEKDLDKYTTPEQIREVFAFIDKLEGVTSLQEFAGIKKLSGFREFYRYRIGDFRLGFRILENQTIQLDRFLHRKDIYKKYP